jgi:signal transduction histidine kinase
MIGAMQDITHQVREEMRISKAIMEAHEEERSYIGEELHDNVNQILAGSLLSLGMVKVSGTDTEKASEFIEMTRSYIGNAIDEIRKLSHQLVPATSKENSLKDIFKNLLANINLDNRFAVSLHFDEFNESDILMMYRSTCTGYYRNR